METNLIWHPDGHAIDLLLNKEEIKVSSNVCPHGESVDADCYHEGVSGCIVKYFINVYGLESNIGQADVAPRIEIAWSVTGSKWDPDLVTLYVIPVDDPTFAEWLSSQMIEEE